MPAVLPNEQEIHRLKQELNFLLWTGDVPEVPPNRLALAANRAQLVKTTVNIQCVAHATVTAGIFMRRGFAVTTRAGMAYLVESSPDGKRENDRLEQIAKHWWITIDGHGLVDLSLHGEFDNPLVYCNRCPGGRWHVAFGDDRQKLERFLKAKQQGCFYLTVAKNQATEAQLVIQLADLFPPARKREIELSHAQLFEHCEKLLYREAQTLTGLQQNEAWERLAGK